MNEDKIIRINNYLLIPVAIISIFSGIISVYKDVQWYVSFPIFVFCVLVLVLILIKKSKNQKLKIIEQKLVVDILDDEGKISRFTNEAMIESLQKNVIDFNYALYADGKIDDFSFEGGVIDTIVHESGKTLVKVNFEKPLQKKEKITCTLHATFHESFTKNNEYFQTTRSFLGSVLKIIILTPDSRKIQNFKAFLINGHEKSLSDIQPKRIILNNKNGIAFDINNAEFMDKFRIEWSW